MLDLFVSLYGYLRNYKGIPFWVFTPFRKFVRCLAHRILPKYLAHSNRGKMKCQTDVIVSFTSFPARILEVWQVVECMLRQSYRPKKIILWLSKDQFPQKENIPLSLREKEGECFNIRLVEGDIRSHKKYYYISKECPDSLILLIDDDIYYPTDMVERLMKAYRNHSEYVICQYGYILQYSQQGELLPYSHWKPMYKETISSNFFFGSGGGTLFKPSQLYSDLTKEDLFSKLTPIADDIWLNTMVRLNSLKCVKIKSGLILPIASSQENVNLSTKNLGQGRNDVQLANVRSYYIKKLGIDPFEKH